MSKLIVLYIHGMGGGVDSRIPSILRDHFFGTQIEVVVRTYDFDPVAAGLQIRTWIGELKPVLLVGESLGANHALIMGREYGIPVILVSPALNAPAFLSAWAYPCNFKLFRTLSAKVYATRPGQRQKLVFERKLLSGWRGVGRKAKDSCKGCFAFFGSRDHYRRWGIVSLHLWRKIAGNDSYCVYDGSHFMEEKYVRTLLADRIKQTVDSKRCQ